MKKVMIIHAYGRNWDYSLYTVSDKTAMKVDELMERGEWAKAYDLVRDNDSNLKKAIMS